MKRYLLIAVGAALALTTAGAAQGDLWIHVKVEERGAKNERVRVNLPLGVLETAATSINLEDVEGGMLKGGKIRIDRKEIEGVELHKLWEAIRNTEDMEFVTVESEDENVRVAKDGKYMITRVHSTGDEEDGGERVEVKVPLSVIDALLSGEQDELDLVAALRALAEHGEGELVQVHDGDSTVKIWIDDKNTSD